MKKILAFSGSNSSKSINKNLVAYAASKFADAEVTTVDLRDYQLPIYGIDEEETNGLPEAAIALKQLFDEHDGYLISLAEHNSSITTFFKNTLDWLSRVEMNVFKKKPILLMGTSPGPGGAKRAMGQGEQIMTGYLQGVINHSYSLPKYFANTQIEDGVIVSMEPEHENALVEVTRAFESSLQEQVA